MTSTVSRPFFRGLTYSGIEGLTLNAESGGIGSVKTGHQVSVTATVSGGTATAASIRDESLLSDGFRHFFGGSGKVATPQS